MSLCSYHSSLVSSRGRHRAAPYCTLPLLLLALLLAGCGEPGDVQEVDQEQNVVLPGSGTVLAQLKDTSLLKKIRYAVLLQDGGTIEGEFAASIQNGTVVGKMEINNVPVGKHTFVLSYVAVINGEEIVIATYTTEFAVQAGRNKLDIAEDPQAGSRLDYPDSDGDKRSDLDEINNHWNFRLANPDRPAHLHGQALDGNVELSWEAQTDATQYTIYMATVPGVNANNYKDASTSDGMKHGPQPGATFNHGGGLRNGVAYYFVVTASNDNGESIESEEIQVIPNAAAISPPAEPINVTASALSGDARINWDTVANADNYTVYWSTLSTLDKTNWEQGGGHKLSVSTPPFFPGGLSNGTQYYFIVTASNAGGESPDSNRVAVTPVNDAPPAPPANITIQSLDQDVSLAWDTVSGLSYNLYMARDPALTKANYASLNDGMLHKNVTPSFSHGTTFGALTNGGTYYFIVTSVRNGVESDASPPVAATPLGPWQNTDIGNPQIAGSSAGGPDQFTVSGAGTDIWDQSDQLQFVYQRLPAAIPSHVLTVKQGIQTHSAASGGWGKTGLMARPSASGASDPYVFALQTALHGAHLQYRASSGAYATGASFDPRLAAPLWFRLIKFGNNFESQFSTDGNKWKVLGALASKNFGGDLYLGMAVTSHDAATASTVNFSNVSISEGRELLPDFANNLQTIDTSQLPTGKQTMGAGNRLYAAQHLTANTKYLVEIINPSADLDLLVYDIASKTFVCGSFLDDKAADACVATSDTNGDLLLRVNGSNAGALNSFALNIRPYANVATKIDASSLTAGGSALVQSDTISDSYKLYQVTGLTANADYRFDLLKQTDNVDLYGYTDEFASVQWIERPAPQADESINAQPRGSSYWLRVDASKTTGTTTSYQLRITRP